MANIPSFKATNRKVHDFFVPAFLQFLRAVNVSDQRRRIRSPQFHGSKTIEPPNQHSDILPAMASLQTCVIIFMLFMFFKFSVKLPIIGSLDTPPTLSTAFVVFHLVPWLLSLARTYRRQPGPRRFSDPVTCLKILKNQPYDDMLGTNKLSARLPELSPTSAWSERSI